jgi:hypothetical protein
MSPLKPFALVAVVAFVALAGCASPASTVKRENADFPILSSVNGVSNASKGDLTLKGDNGIRLVNDPANSTITASLGPVVENEGVIRACRGVCNAVGAQAGMIVAEGSLVSFNNLSLNAIGPDRDSAVFFHDNGAQSGQYLRWHDARSRFEVSADTLVDGSLRSAGNITAREYVGTSHELELPNGGVARIHTAALEGNEAAVYLRGTARLTNGTARISFPDEYKALLAEDGFMTVHVTLTSKGPGLWVSLKTTEGIEIGRAHV